tara:strand:+ start:512 stop:691 length:180 start_codon:yes stop_codon:yes gene_type:complete
MTKLTKEQIVGELLAEEQISAEEAITLLTPVSISYNINIPKDNASESANGIFWEQNSTY